MIKGYFDDAKKEFVITDMYPAKPQSNYLWTEDTICVVDHFGNGYSICLRDGKWRDIELGERNVYIKDRKTGYNFSPNRNFNKEKFDLFECHVGLGYQTIFSENKGIRTEFTILVPNDYKATMYRVKITNISKEKKELDSFVNTVPKANLTVHSAQGEAFFDEKNNYICFCHNAFEYDAPYKYVYYKAEKQVFAYDTTKSSFIGTYNDSSNPIALEGDKLSCKDIDFVGDYMGVFQFRFDLEPGQVWENVFMCGVGESTEDCAKLSQYCTNGNFEKELIFQEKYNDSYLETFQVDSPDKIYNSQVNIWLKRQLSFGKTWGRMWGKGFRDVMQDITSFASFDPPLAKKRILYALKHIYENGNPIRMFEPTYLYPYNDGAIWIPSAILAYLYESGDRSILDEQLQFLPGNSLEKSVYDDGSFSYPTYKGTDYTTSVFDHVKRSIDYILSARGERGLVLFYGGDWNDSINAAGKEGKGESVWLSIATYKAVKEFEEILSLYGKEDLIPSYVEKREELRNCIIKNGFDTDHFLYGINDIGEKIGSDESEEAKIFLNPQSWAVLAGIFDEVRLKELMDVVEKRLICDFGYVQCTPSYTKGNKHIGRITHMMPGTYENGAVYNHGVAFKIVADCLLGKGDTAYQTYLKIRYDNPLNKNSVVEPYAITNMYFGPENRYRPGYSPASWITGTAGWLYRGLTEFLCGVIPTFNGLKIKPCFPSEWENVSVKRKFRKSIYNIKYVKSNEFKIVVDGNEYGDSVLPFGNREYDVIVYFN